MGKEKRSKSLQTIIRKIITKIKGRKITKNDYKTG